MTWIIHYCHSSDEVEEDCDDTDPSKLDNIDDADCDGFATAIDCDDSDESKYNGSEDCPEKSCWHILQKNNLAPNGHYWIDPEEEFCVIWSQMEPISSRMMTEWLIGLVQPIG